VDQQAKFRKRNCFLEEGGELLAGRGVESERVFDRGVPSPTGIEDETASISFVR